MLKVLNAVWVTSLIINSIGFGFHMHSHDAFGAIVGGFSIALAVFFLQVNFEDWWEGQRATNI